MGKVFLNTDKKKRCITSPATLEARYVSTTKYRLKGHITDAFDDLEFIIQNCSDEKLKSHIYAQLSRITGEQVAQPAQEEAASYEDDMWAGKDDEDAE